MARPSALFDCLTVDLRHHLTLPSGAGPAARWASLDPAFAGCADNAAVLDHLMDSGRSTAARRRDLAVVVCSAATDPVAAVVVFAACINGLRAVAGQLARAWSADPAEVDQAVAVAGWARVTRESGRRLEWPDRVIVGGARTAVRDDLRAEARYHRRIAPAAEIDLAVAGDGVVSGGEWADAAELMAAAVRRGTVSGRSAQLVWETRVLGVPVKAVAAQWGQAPSAVVMRRLRAERALRSDLADRSDDREAS
jgi:hypothetical protein